MQGTKKLFDQLDQFGNILRELIVKLDERRILSDYAEQLKRRHRQLKKLAEEIGNFQRLRVSVVGNFNSGKSSFINSLIGRDVCVVGVNPTTSSVTKFFWSETERICWSNGEKGRKDISQEEYKNLTCHKLDKNETFHEFEYSLKDFPFKEIELFDTPGFNNSKHIDDDENTMTIAKKTDIIFFLMDINKGNPDKIMLEKVSELVNGHKKKCYLILNQADSKKSPAERKRICEENQNRHGSVFSKIFLYSSKYGGGDQKYFDKKKEEVIQFVDSFQEKKADLYNIRYEERTKSLLADVTSIICKLSDDVDPYMRGLDRNRKVIEINLAKLKHLQKVFGSVTKYASRLNNYCKTHCIRAYFLKRGGFFWRKKLYKFSFYDQTFQSKFRTQLYKILDGGSKNHLPKELYEQIDVTGREIAKKIRTVVSKKKPFEEDELGTMFEKMDFTNQIEQGLSGLKNLPVLNKPIKKIEKESLEFQYFNELFSLLNKLKSSTNGPKTARRGKGKTVKSV